MYFSFDVLIDFDGFAINCCYRACVYRLGLTLFYISVRRILIYLFTSNLFSKSNVSLLKVLILGPYIGYWFSDCWPLAMYCVTSQSHLYNHFLFWWKNCFTETHSMIFLAFFCGAVKKTSKWSIGCSLCVSTNNSNYLITASY